MIDRAKFLTTSMYMFDPNDPSDDEFREECALAAGMLLEFIGSDSPLELEDPIALGGAVVAAAALAKVQSMDLHELLGAVMSAYRDTRVQTVDLDEDDDIEGEDDETRH